jgi:probable addiction module antidote protein
MPSYKDDLLNDLRTEPGYAAKYLTAAAADSTEAFLVALRDVGIARKGMTSLAAAAEVNRVNLYQMLSKKGNPGIRNIRAIFDALKLRIVVEEDSQPSAAPTPSSRRSEPRGDPHGAVPLVDLTRMYGPGMQSPMAGCYFVVPQNQHVGFRLDAHGRISAGLQSLGLTSPESGSPEYLLSWGNNSQPSHLAINQ